MPVMSEILHFDQLHIDIARNSTDDFNPFHDPSRWSNICANPFRSTIVLGFQLELLVEDRILGHRGPPSDPRGANPGLSHRNYDFIFAGALEANEAFRLELRKPLKKRDGKAAGFSNRAVLRKQDGTLVLTGTVSESDGPQFAADATLAGVPALESVADRTQVPGTAYFLKRKFLNTSNGKNFCLACHLDQRLYFDELAESVSFPPLFTVALLSSALLEKAWLDGYDFEADPLVYTRHRISVDLRLQRALRSNDCLHLLVAGPLPAGDRKGLGRVAIEQQRHRCLGVVRGREVLFRADVEMAPLHAMRQEPLPAPEA